MADPPPYPGSNSETGEDIRARPDRGSTTSTPRWVKAFGILAFVLVLLLVIMMLTGRGGSHDPGRHIPFADTPPSSVTEHSVQRS